MYPLAKCKGPVQSYSKLVYFRPMVDMDNLAINQRRSVAMQQNAGTFWRKVSISDQYLIISNVGHLHPLFPMYRTR